ncbi:hypothetical protein GNY06_07470 [Elizabethkingia argentiflava]|uniref:Carboxypeptidase-like regulatory domain-containing protein n=1 Tax=Elizabethkingia argenteiflava TaxID=2681556 RepID=A0A845PYR0_9FLAO|nr:DUF5686 family protein [Elizabethkingia argenteiflava]NAW51220.1 hypothetical protein [Elizabethkingia argenteiflava]
MIKKLFFCSFTCLVIIKIDGQLKLTGKITDFDSQKTITGAVLNNKQNTAISDNNGFFELNVQDSTGVITVQKRDYRLQKIAYDLHADSLLPIVLHRAVNTANKYIEGVIINTKKKYKNKKENPAYAILKAVWKRHYKNAFDTYDNYKYSEYQKLEASLNNLDSSFINKKIFKGMEFMFKNVDTAFSTGKAFVPIYMNEQLSTYYKVNRPFSKEKKVLIAEKASGFEDYQFMVQTIQNLYKDFNIYDNQLNFFDKGFTSPLSTEGFGVYDYTLMQDNIIDGEACYTIKYIPRSNAVFAFRGVIFISKEAFAVKKITLNSPKNIDVNFIRGVNAELTYHIIDDKSFRPEKSQIMVDMSLLNKKANAKGLYVNRIVSYKDFEVNKPEIAKEIETKTQREDQHIYTKDEAFWNHQRHEPLTPKDSLTYQNLNRLWQLPKFKTAVKLVEAIGSGFYNIGNAVDVGNLYSLYGHNDIEGDRLRLGARTFFSRNDMWRLEGYGAYGFRDQKFKFGIGGRYMLDKYKRFTLGYRFKRDLQQLAVDPMGEMNSSVGTGRSFASSSIANTGNNFYLSNIVENNIYASVEPFLNFQVTLDGSYREIKAADPRRFNINYISRVGVEKSQANDARASLVLTYRPGAQFAEYGVDRNMIKRLFPTFTLRYTKGISGVFKSDFNYDRIQFSYVQPVLIGSIGQSNINIEGGKTFGTVPLSLMNVLPGNQSYISIPNTFSQLDYYEFVTDAYSNLFWEHHFNGWVFNRIPLLKKLKLREIVFFRGAWGSLRSDNIDVSRSNIVYKAPKDHIYYEYGFGIENIGFSNFRMFRADFNWRGNYLDHPEARKFGIKVGLQLGF